ERDAVFYLARSKIVQHRPPLRQLFEIIRAFRNENVTGVATIHHALRDVDAGTGDVPLLTQVSHFLHRPAVNPMRTRNSGCFFNSRAIATAHFTGSSGLVRKTSAPPSPVGNRISFPSRCATRNVSVARAISRSFSKCSSCS